MQQQKKYSGSKCKQAEKWQQDTHKEWGKFESEIEGEKKTTFFNQNIDDNILEKTI